MNVKRAAIWLIGILVIIALVVGAVQIIRGPPPAKDLILNTIALQSAADQVAQAKLITDMDKMAKRLDNPAITTQWVSLTACAAQKACTDDDYFNLVYAAAAELPEHVPNAQLVLDLVAANRYWGSERIVEFSKALASANDQVAALQVSAVSTQWDNVVACAGTCPEYHQNFYELIRLIVQVE